MDFFFLTGEKSQTKIRQQTMTNMTSISSNTRTHKHNANSFKAKLLPNENTNSGLVLTKKVQNEYESGGNQRHWMVDYVRMKVKQLYKSR